MNSVVDFWIAGFVAQFVQEVPTMRFRMFIILLALFGAIATANDIHGAPPPKALSACAAFAPNGTAELWKFHHRLAGIDFPLCRAS